MKTSTTLVTMTLMLLLLALTLPAGAADYTLGIFGNANEDETINMQDVTYTELIILEYRDETELADGKHDGKINMQDVTQIELVILGRELELTLIDQADRIVTVKKPVERIVSTHYADTEAIKILGAWERVVAADYYGMDELLFPGADDLPLAEGPMGAYDVYYETVFEVDPDVFLTCACPYPGLDDVVATLEPEIPVVALNFYEPDTLIENIKKLRYILNTKEEGDEFIAFYEGVINDITEKIDELPENEKPRVFFKAAGWTPEALSTFASKSDLGAQIGIAGGINIACEDEFGELEFVSDVDLEWLIGENPDIVVANVWEVHNPGVFGFEVDDPSAAEATRDEIMAMDVFAGGKAVEDGRVYLYVDDFTGTPRFVAGIAYMAKWFHPELFEDLDPKAIHQQYLTDFMRIDYDLGEQGVFVYPEP